MNDNTVSSAPPAVQPRAGAGDVNLSGNRNRAGGNFRSFDRSGPKGPATDIRKTLEDRDEGYRLDEAHVLYSLHNASFWVLRAPIWSFGIRYRAYRVT